MKKIKYEFRKFFIIILILHLIHLCYEVFINEMPFINELKWQAFSLSIISLLCWKIVNSENTKDNNGVYVSNDFILIRKNDQEFKCLWNDLKAQKIFNFFSVLYLVKLNYSCTEKPYLLLLFSGSEKSIQAISEQYIPNDHELKKIVNDYFS